MKKGDFKELNTGISYINSVLLLTLIRPEGAKEHY